MIFDPQRKISPSDSINSLKNSEISLKDFRKIYNPYSSGSNTNTKLFQIYSIQTVQMMIWGRFKKKIGRVLNLTEGTDQERIRIDESFAINPDAFESTLVTKRFRGSNLDLAKILKGQRGEMGEGQSSNGN